MSLKQNMIAADIAEAAARKSRRAARPAKAMKPTTSDTASIAATATVDPDAPGIVQTDVVEAVAKAIDGYGEETLAEAHRLIVGKLQAARMEFAESRGNREATEAFEQTACEILVGASYLERSFAHGAAIAAIRHILTMMRTDDYRNVASGIQGEAIADYCFRVIAVHAGGAIPTLMKRLAAHWKQYQSERRDEATSQDVSDAFWKAIPDDGPERIRKLNAALEAVKSDKRVDAKGRVMRVHRKH